MTPPVRQKTYLFSWTTRDEEAFVRGLGTGLFTAPRLDRLALLQRYRTAMTLRMDWGAIKCAAVLQTVSAVMREMRDESDPS